jgi:16S rRNA (guanine527-N7)-methyltransferase
MPWLGRLPHGIDALQLLTQFGLLVHEYAGRSALIAKGDRPTLLTRHVLDSLNPVALFPSPPKSALDVGSGAGFPGFPLAICWPSTEVYLLDSREKKVGFMELAVRELGLKNLKVVLARVEDLRSAWRAAPVEAAFIRALGDLPHLLTAIEPACAPGARWVYFLGAQSDPGELTAAAAGGRWAGRAPALAAAKVDRGEFGGKLLHGTLGGAASPH